MQQIEAFNRQRQQKEDAAVLERSFHNGLLSPPPNGDIAGAVRALVKDANMNAFALVMAGTELFAVPVSDADRDRLVVGEPATFQADDGTGHYALVVPAAKTVNAPNSAKGITPGF